MVTWAEIQNKIDIISGNITTLTADENTAGSIAKKQAILDGLNTTKSAISTAVGGNGTLANDTTKLNTKVDALDTHVDSAITYLSSLGDTTSGIIKDINDALLDIKTIYNNYVTEYNDYNDPAGALQVDLTALETDMTTLGTYTEVDITGAALSTSVDPFTILVELA